MTRTQPDILCIGSVLWDIIGRTNLHMREGSDVPGHITRLPGGVAMNIAMTLARLGLRPALLSVIGRDRQGDDLIHAAQSLGIDCAYLYRSDDLPTDRYMAIEAANGLMAAIADAHSLEKAGEKILTPLRDGRLGDAQTPWRGLIALDGNLTEALLAEIARSPDFAAADLRVAPASPGKAGRLLALLRAPNATLYVNLEEAGLLCHAEFPDAAAAAAALVARGARRALVTDGARPAADAMAGEPTLSATPPAVMVTRVTGAGDTFMAAHIVGEIQSLGREAALERALRAAALYVSGDLRA